MPSTSASLLNRMKTGASNDSAWQRFVQIYTPLLMHWIGRMGLNSDDSADIVQDVLLAMTVRLPTFTYDSSSSFRAWLRTITLNKCRDLLRKNGIRKHHESNQEIVFQRSADSLFSDMEFNQLLACRALELMRSEFEETTWRACWESTVNNRKASEVADILGISKNAVYLAKGRVLRRLREELKGML